MTETKNQEKRKNIHFSSKTSDWSTPEILFKQLDREFHFTVDVAANKNNAKCKKFFSEEMDGLSQNWENERVFCNPPYGYGINAWIAKLAGGGCGSISRACPRQNRHTMVS